MIQKKRETNIHLSLERIKKLVVVAMFSDDDLMDVLVLKGGNAMALIHKLTSRASVDIDFSMHRDFVEGPLAVKERIANALKRTFRPEGYEPFDIKMIEKPATVSPELASFWGGYGIEFKLVSTQQFMDLKDDEEALRKAALSIGQGQKFFIDISRYEYINDKQVDDLDGYRIYVYTPLMIACEKFRAICQQMEEYSSVIKREKRPGTQRARDFIDIYVLIEQFKIDVISVDAIETIAQMFAIKHVPIYLLGLINKNRAFHGQGFASVKDTVSHDFDLKNFDFYVDYVVDKANLILSEIQRNSKITSLSE